MPREKILWSVILLIPLLLFSLHCGKDRANPTSAGAGNGNFAVESGPALSQEELGKALDLTKATNGLTTAAAGGNTQAANALIGVGFAQTAIQTLMGILNNGNLLGKTNLTAAPADEVPVELGNGITLVITKNQVTSPTEGVEMTWKLTGTCTQNSSISFNNDEVATGFLSNTYRNGKFSYNFGDLYQATTCGSTAIEGTIEGNYTVEWAISSNGVTKIYVNLDINQSVTVNGNSVNTQLKYEATISINSDGTGNIKGSINGTAQGISYNQSFDVSW